LYPKLITGKAGTLQEKQGNKATEVFRKLLEKKLTRPKKKIKRKIFIYAADEHFDQYGRLLAYMSPKYSKRELATITREDRATFNLLMVETGWAAPFPIFPSIPRHVDLTMLQQAAKKAFTQKKGCWKDPKMLTGYEFRMCVRLYEITKKLVNNRKLSSKEKYGWIHRYCADMTTKEIFYEQDYYKVKPYNRIFIWPKDVMDAVGKMNLVPPK
jgi:endonuclease YncB( thermonuclease family)